MKKIICVILAALLLLICACGCNIATHPTTEATDASTNPTLAGGLEDSIFDNDGTVPSEPASAESVAPENETTESTEPAGTTEATESSTATESTEPEQTQPTEPVTTQPDDHEIGYAEFMAMSPADQRKFQESFGQDEASLDAFFAWYNAAKEKYEKENPPIDVGNGTIDWDKLFGDNG